MLVILPILSFSLPQFSLSLDITVYLSRQLIHFVGASTKVLYCILASGINRILVAADLPLSHIVS